MCATDIYTVRSSAFTVESRMTGAQMSFCLDLYPTAKIDCFLRAVLFGHSFIVLSLFTFRATKRPMV